MSLRYSINILCPPSSEVHSAAIDICSSLLQAGHQLHHVFFYAEATQVANQLVVADQNSPDMLQRWLNLAEQYGFPLKACVAASLRRGVIDDQEAGFNNKAASSCHPGIQLTGLGDWLEGSHNADRTLTFK